MANIVSYNDIIELLTSISERHYQINTFYLGKDWEPEQNADIQYPMFQVYPEFATMPINDWKEFKTLEFTLNCKILDLTTPSEENEKDVHSDTLRIAQDIVNELNQHPYYINSNVSLISSIDFNALEEHKDDITAGWNWKLVMRVINANTFCGMPIADLDGVSASGPTSSGQYVYTQFLTCETLPDCPVIQDIQASIAGLTGATGTTNTFDNGLTLTGNNVQLGGTLIHHTDIDGAFRLNFGQTTALQSFNLFSGGVGITADTTITSASSGLSSFNLNDNIITLRNNNLFGTDISQLQITNTYLRLQFTNNVNSGIIEINQNNLLIAHTSDIIISGNGNTSFVGAQYDLDYSANFINESLVTKRYVLASIAAATPTIPTLAQVLTNDNSTGDQSIVSISVISTLAITDSEMVLGWDDGTITNFLREDVNGNLLSSNASNNYTAPTHNFNGELFSSSISGIGNFAVTDYSNYLVWDDSAGVSGVINNITQDATGNNITSSIANNLNSTLANNFTAPIHNFDGNISFVNVGSKIIFPISSYIEEVGTLPSNNVFTIASGPGSISIKSLKFSLFNANLSYSATNGTVTSVVVSHNGVNLTSNNVVSGYTLSYFLDSTNNKFLFTADATSIGLVGSNDWSANYTSLSFVQKSYVDALVLASTPDATPTVKGKAKLYTTLGTNTDGAVDQNTINSNLLTKRNFSRTTFGNANYSVLVTDDYVTTSVAFTAPRTVTLDATRPANKDIIIADDLGTITSVNTLTIAVPSGKYLNGVLNGTEIIAFAGAQRRLFSDGSGNYSFDAGIVRTTKTQTLSNKTLDATNVGVTAAADSNNTGLATNAYVDRGWTDFSATSNPQGFSVVSVNNCWYKTFGSTVMIIVNISGTSNASTLSFTLPFTPAMGFVEIPYILNNGVGAAGRLVVSLGSTTCTIHATPNAGTFTASGTKRVDKSFTYIK